MLTTAGPHPPNHSATVPGYRRGNRGSAGPSGGRSWDRVWVWLARSPAVTPEALWHCRRRTERTETGFPVTLGFRLGAYLGLCQDDHFHQVHSELSPQGRVPQQF